jgi:hypothetical protein
LVTDYRIQKKPSAQFDPAEMEPTITAIVSAIQDGHELKVEGK